MNTESGAILTFSYKATSDIYIRIQSVQPDEACMPHPKPGTRDDDFALNYDLADQPTPIDRRVVPDRGDEIAVTIPSTSFCEAAQQLQALLGPNPKASASTKKPAGKKTTPKLDLAAVRKWFMAMGSDCIGADWP